MVACRQGQGSCQEWGWSWKTNCGQESPDLEGGVLFYKRGGGGLWLSISLVKAYQHYPIWIFLFVLHLIVFSSKGSQTSLAS